MIEEKDKGLIVQNYRLAKDKENQVSIEAELHGVGPEVIRSLLWKVPHRGSAELRRMRRRR